jgi:FkbM family methyltransferase
MWQSSVRNLIPEPLYARLQFADHYLHGEKEIRLLRHLCDPKRVSLDIGANIGTYTYWMRRHSRRVYAYEPNPDLAARLNRLYSGDIVVRHAAVSDRCGEMILRIPVKGGRPMHEEASVSMAFEKAEAVIEHLVPTVRIDDENCGDVGFIKIDVEQHDTEVIAGAMWTIKHRKPTILTEITPLLYPKPFLEMFKPVLDLGYIGWFCFEGRYRPFAEFDPEIHARAEWYPDRFMEPNVIFLPHGYRDLFFLLHAHD